jgi:hypothetical protein
MDSASERVVQEAVSEMVGLCTWMDVVRMSATLLALAGCVQAMGDRRQGCRVQAVIPVDVCGDAWGGVPRA